jgi:hypothetical protein
MAPRRGPNALTLRVHSLGVSAKDARAGGWVVSLLQPGHQGRGGQLTLWLQVGFRVESKGMSYVVEEDTSSAGATSVFEPPILLKTPYYCISGEPREEDSRSNKVDCPLILRLLGTGDEILRECQLPLKSSAGMREAVLEGDGPPLICRFTMSVDPLPEATSNVSGVQAFVVCSTLYDAECKLKGAQLFLRCRDRTLGSTLPCPSVEVHEGFEWNAVFDVPSSVFNSGEGAILDLVAKSGPVAFSFVSLQYALEGGEGGRWLPLFRRTGAHNGRETQEAIGEVWIVVVPSLVPERRSSRLLTIPSAMPALDSSLLSPDFGEDSRGGHALDCELILLVHVWDCIHLTPGTKVYLRMQLRCAEGPAILLPNPSHLTTKAVPSRGTDRDARAVWDQHLQLRLGADFAERGTVMEITCVNADGNSAAEGALASISVPFAEFAVSKGHGDACPPPALHKLLLSSRPAPGDNASSHSHLLVRISAMCVSEADITPSSLSQGSRVLDFITRQSDPPARSIDAGKFEGAGAIPEVDIHAVEDGSRLRSTVGKDGSRGLLDIAAALRLFRDATLNFVSSPLPGTFSDSHDMLSPPREMHGCLNANTFERLCIERFPNASEGSISEALSLCPLSFSDFAAWLAVGIGEGWLPDYLVATTAQSLLSMPAILDSVSSRISMLKEAMAPPVPLQARRLSRRLSEGWGLGGEKWDATFSSARADVRDVCAVVDFWDVSHEERDAPDRSLPVDEAACGQLLRSLQELKEVLRRAGDGLWGTDKLAKDPHDPAWAKQTELMERIKEVKGMQQQVQAAWGYLKNIKRLHAKGESIEQSKSTLLKSLRCASVASDLPSQDVPGREEQAHAERAMHNGKGQGQTESFRPTDEVSLSSSPPELHISVSKPCKISDASALAIEWSEASAARLGELQQALTAAALLEESSHASLDLSLRKLRLAVGDQKAAPLDGFSLRMFKCHGKGDLAAPWAISFAFDALSGVQETMSVGGVGSCDENILRDALDDIGMVAKSAAGQSLHKCEAMRVWEAIRTQALDIFAGNVAAANSEQEGGTGGMAPRDSPEALLLLCYVLAGCKESGNLCVEDVVTAIRDRRKGKTRDEGEPIDWRAPACHGGSEDHLLKNYEVPSWVPSELRRIFAASRGLIEPSCADPTFALRDLTHLLDLNATAEALQFGSSGLTLLHVAAISGNVPFIELLIKRGTSRVFKRDFTGRLPRHYTRRADVLQALGGLVSSSPIITSKKTTDSRSSIYAQKAGEVSARHVMDEMIERIEGSAATLQPQRRPPLAMPRASWMGKLRRLSDSQVIWAKFFCSSCEPSSCSTCSGGNACSLVAYITIEEEITMRDLEQAERSLAALFEKYGLTLESIVQGLDASVDLDDAQALLSLFAFEVGRHAGVSAAAVKSQMLAVLLDGAQPSARLEVRTRAGSDGTTACTVVVGLGSPVHGSLQRVRNLLDAQNHPPSVLKSFDALTICNVFEVFRHLEPCGNEFESYCAGSRVGLRVETIPNGDISRVFIAHPSLEIECTDVTGLSVHHLFRGGGNGKESRDSGGGRRQSHHSSMKGATESSGAAATCSTSSLVSISGGTMAAEALAHGDRVEARFGGLSKFYPAVVKAINVDGTYSLQYDDGDAESFVPRIRIRLPEQKQPKVLAIGSIVEAKVPRRSKGYTPGRIVATDSKGCYDIEFDDGDRETRVARSSIFAMHLWPPESAAACDPAKGDGIRQDSQRKIGASDGLNMPPYNSAVGLLSAGQQVEARFGGLSGFYPGVIEMANSDGSYALKYADGDSEASVPRIRIRFPGQKQPRVLTPGSDVDVKIPRRGKRYTPGRILAVDQGAETYQVVFEDGEVESGVQRGSIFAMYQWPQSDTEAASQVSGKGEDAGSLVSQSSFAPSPSVASMTASYPRLGDSALAIAVGTNVEARFGGLSSFYPAVIDKVHPDGTVSLTYADGDAEDSVPRIRIRLPGQKQAKVLVVGSPVEAKVPGRGKRFLPGRVRAVSDNGCYDIDFDDGDQVAGVARSSIFAMHQWPPGSEFVGEGLQAERAKNAAQSKPAVTVTSTASTVSCQPGEIINMPLQGRSVEEHRDSCESSYQLAARLSVTSLASNINAGGTVESLADGQEVEARFGSLSSFYPAIVHGTNADGTYALQYADGDREDSVHRLRIRLSGQKQPKVLAVGSEVDVRIRRRGKGYAIGHIVAAGGGDLYDVEFHDGDRESGVARSSIFAAYQWPPSEGVTLANAAQTRSLTTSSSAASSLVSSLPAGEREGSVLEVGSQVQARSGEQSTFCPAIVNKVNTNGTYDLRYGDSNSEASVPRIRIRMHGEKQPKVLAVGAEVEAKMARKGNKWMPGHIGAVKGNSYRVDFVDGDVGENVDRGAIFAMHGVPIRLPKPNVLTSCPREAVLLEAGQDLQALTAARGSDASLVSNVYSPRATDTLRQKQHVESRFGGLSMFYPAIIERANGDGTYDIKYGDGDEEAAVPRIRIRLPGQKQPKDLAAGSEIEAKVQRRGKRYSTGHVVAMNDDGSYHIRFDDGDEEPAVNRNSIFATHQWPPGSSGLLDGTAPSQPAGTTSTASTVSCHAGDVAYMLAQECAESDVLGANNAPYHVANPPGSTSQPPTDVAKETPKTSSNPAALPSAASLASTLQADEAIEILALGQEVEARFGALSSFYPAVVEHSNTDGSYGLKYNDGDEEDFVPRIRIRLPGQKQPKVLGVGNEVDAKVPRRGTHYTLGRIATVSADGTYCVAFNDGDQESGVERRFIFAMHFWPPSRR